MKTAVEWLYERLERMIPRSALYDIDKREYFKQAKEMERQQIIDAYWEIPLPEEKYFEKTFKSEKDENKR
jgi:hypothetical protein